MATLGFLGERTSELNGNHLEIVKFSSTDDNNYERVAGNISRLNEILIQPQENHESNTYKMDEKNSQCLKDLQTTDPRHDKTRIEKDKGRLLEDSYRWIFENADFRQWDDDQQSRLLWIKGDPGKGKTMLLCGIINEFSKLTVKTGLLSFFFCEGTMRITTATAVLRGLIYLLVDQQPSLIRYVQEKYDHAGKALFEDINAWVALSEIFSNIVQDLSLKNVYLIIDALDECQTDDLPLFLDFIVQKSSIYPHVKWIVSSRVLLKDCVKFRGNHNFTGL